MASNVISLLNVVLPAAERWFGTTLNEALPLVNDPHLADDMRGFIGQEAMHADVHEQVLHGYLVANGVDPKPMLDQIEFVFEKELAPTTSTDPKRPAVADRGDLALHRGDGRFRVELHVGRLQGRADDDRPVPLARQRRSRTPDGGASYSCQQGYCGTCRTRVLDSTVDHRDTLLTDPERGDGMMLICMSRAAGGSELTLDL